MGRTIRRAREKWRKQMFEDDLIITERDFERVAALRPEGQLEKELERALVVPDDEVPRSVVTMHSRVRYLDETLGLRREIQIVYPEQADLAQAKISVLAPVGAALLGLSVGQAIEWQFPDGALRRLRVEELLFQPESHFAMRRKESDAQDELERMNRAIGCA
jgi:regulator of nucleoside diphosphate kinase